MLNCVVCGLNFETSRSSYVTLNQPNKDLSYYYCSGRCLTQIIIRRLLLPKDDKASELILSESETEVLTQIHNRFNTLPSRLEEARQREIVTQE